MTTATLIEARAGALLGENPRLTLVDGNDPDTCLSVLLTRAGRVWVGLVDDRAAILDRVRLGLVPRFVVHPDASTSTVSGEAGVRILGRADGLADPRVQALVAAQPFGVAHAVAVEVAPRALVLEPEEPAGAVTGAVPRT
jgi:hypothetical protein